MLKLIIFDLDGTLLDTLQDLAAATNEALAEFSLPALPDEAYKQMVGMGARVLMQRAVARSKALLSSEDPRRQMPDPEPHQLVDAFNRAYESRWSDQTRPYPGIPDLLDHLSNHDVQLAILSNKPDAFTRKIADRYFPEGLFRSVYGMRPDLPGKPDPATTLALCRMLQVDPSEAALIGDSGSDMTAAVAAGALPVGVLWGFRSEEELRTHGAKVLAQSPADLETELLRLIGP